MDENNSQPEVSAVVAAGDPDVTMEVLRSHVPITLLMDIGSADGPDSVGIAASEGGDAAWLLPADEQAQARAQADDETAEPVAP